MGYLLILLVVVAVFLNDGGLAEDTSLGVRNSFDQLQSEIADLRKEVEKLKKADEEPQKDLLDSVPLGSILPWVNKPSEGSPHQEDLPLGFALCDGSPITEGVWQGQLTPDLTTTGKFLRGGDFAQVLDMEEAMIGDHVHIDSGHSHSDAGHTHEDGGHTHPYEDKYIQKAQSMNGVGTSQTAKSNYLYDQSTSSTSYANISTSYASIENSTSGMGGVSTKGGKRVGEEGHPSNMRVLFIMKVASVE